MVMLEQKLATFQAEIFARQDQKLTKLKEQLESQLATTNAGIMDTAVSKVQEDIKTMMGQNVIATSAMIQAS
eukprot:14196047-Ditylum_brightwellii.AAC.1